MKTCNSLSGGKTSSYMAVKYPSDIEVFALCCIDCHNAGRDISKVMKQRVNDKLQKYCSHMPEFVATSEDAKVLQVMFDLEQKIGREIIWLRGIGWEEMIRQKKAIPNTMKRFCTTILKMQPIFEFLFKHHELPVKMRIGYRWDEMERVKKFNENFKYAYKTEWQQKSSRLIFRWKNIQWRVGDFPLIRDKVIYSFIENYWKHDIIDFPDDSNCLNCIWKPVQQLRKNFDTCEPVMVWSMITEEMEGHTFKNNMSMRQIIDLPILNDFHYGTGSGCQAGFCTD